MLDEVQLQKAAETSSREFFRLIRRTLRDVEKIPQDIVNSLILRWLKHHPPAQTSRFLPKLAAELARRRSIQSAWNLVSFLEVVFRLRKPRVAIYDHAFHYIGGSQKYGSTIAQALQDEFEVTLLANKPVALADLEAWYGLDLSRCRLEVVPLPYFEEKSRYPQIIEPGEVNTSGENPFHAVSRESGNHDIFVNNGMLEMVYPLSNTSLFICHFPEREKSRFFYVDRYTEIIPSSMYSARWIEKRWNLRPHKHIYPPVDMEPAAFPLKKENIILSVSRFDVGGNKQQMEMVKVFQGLARNYPRELDGWKLILVGGSTPANPYLERIEDHLHGTAAAKIELQVNIPASELRSAYEKAKIFWHFCGLGQTDPAKVEHFGMTVAEAMQNGCVPVVFRGGGQTETVEDGVSGFLFTSEREIADITLRLLNNPVEFEEMSGRACQRGKKFSREVFVDEVRAHFRGLLATRFSEASSR
ncbi:MAG: glycosyltransferase family 4 protein [Clostridiales bacterium]|nr:glycosyltransferase family 4 protein [Clostridiales bacterium]